VTDRPRVGGGEPPGAQISPPFDPHLDADATSDTDQDQLERSDGGESCDRQPVDASLSIIDRPPTCSVMVRVDLATLLRGSVHPGECCAIDNQGPIPVPMARDMASDSFLRFVFHEAGDIRAVSHFGRTVNRHLRTALAHRDKTCVVPGCGVSFGLEIDHVIPFADGGPTALDNLALLCHHHHFLKTFEGWTLSRNGTEAGGQAIWRFEPQPSFGQEPVLGIDTPEGRATWWETQG
jgi:hypothetical protein